MKAQKKKVEFPDSGKTAWIPAISMSGLAMKLTRKYTRPNPPRQQVDYGDGVKRWEYNYAHPDYRIALGQWENFVDTAVQQAALARVYTMTLTDEQRVEVAEWRKANPGQWDELDSDGALWLEEIALTTDSDFQALISAIRGIDEEVVDSIQDSFPGDV